MRSNKITRSPRTISPRACVYALVAASGLATLSWEVMWQIKASLALGVSAWGTAITLAVTMGGMSIGSFLSGRALKDKFLAYPLRLYGAFEIVIGICGLLLGIAFRVVENIDTSVYAGTPGDISLVYLFGITAVLGVPGMCMGATLPVFGMVARQFRTSIATLYGLNTLGAASGALFAAFVLIPLFGVARAAWVIAAINIAAGLSAFAFGPAERVAEKRATAPKPQLRLGPLAQPAIVMVTGFATFALEIAWFRSFTAAFQSTTDAFAVMLAALLIALGAAASLVPILKKMKVPLSVAVCWAGILILLVTPLIERFDRLVVFDIHPSILLILNWFILTLTAIGPPVLLLGVPFPWILDDERAPRRWAMLYSLNTLAAILGAIGAAWLLLPAIGLARTAWLAGSLVLVTGIFTARRKQRKVLAACGIAALLIAVLGEAGLGRTQIEGHITPGTNKLAKILEFYEGPEATVSAIEYANGGRALIVDGFVTATQFGTADKPADHYMAWMGHLPMLLHPDPQNALVICFGTGQTANAVRQENPQSLDIVDINPRIFKLAHNFERNEDVLGDARVKTIVMDGRAYMRRTDKTYDIITLEPMPPNFAGVNALYSKEFYQLARARLSPKGVIAQWVPFHLVAPPYAASIAKTFQSIFPNAILWIDPLSKTGILLGSKDDSGTLGRAWPGFKRTRMAREHSESEVRDAVLLDRDELQRYAAQGEIITDDNQLLAYGKALSMAHGFRHLQEENDAVLNQAKKGETP